MCNKNYTDTNEASTGCARKIPQIKMKPVWDVEENLPGLKKKEEASMGRVRETPHRKTKQAWDV